MIDENRVREIVNESEQRLLERMDQIETNLLRAFHGYAQGVSSHFRRLDVGDATFNERLSALEDRVVALETRPPR